MLSMSRLGARVAKGMLSSVCKSQLRGWWTRGLP